MIEAKIITDSIANGIRLTTMQLAYPRFIHSEFMTHRMFCLSGDSILEFDLPSGSKKGKFKRVFTMTLAEFSDKWFNGDSLGRSMRHRLSNMRIRQLNEDTKKIDTCTVSNCFISGEKEVFEISAGDMKVSGSKDHRILTTDGWKTIENLEVGKDFIITRAFGKLGDDVLDPIRLKKFGNSWKSTWLNQIRQEKLDDQNFSCYDCGTELLTVDHELHHVVPVYEDESLAFEYTNIIALCKDCHKDRHKTQGWQGDTYLYGKPEKLKSIVSKGVQMTYDLEMNSEYENFVANGIIVHNSRNASSSRAIPVAKMIEQVRDNPAMPIHWGKNQPGMQAYEELDPTSGIGWWQGAVESAVYCAEELSSEGYHKQIVNRLLEPFQHIHVIVTATEWENFFFLRDSEAAQPEIRELARVMRKAMDESKPQELEAGEWHLPYIHESEITMAQVGASDPYCLNLDDLIKCSIARCARVSYLNHDQTKPDIEKDIILAGKLISMKHMSPTEHQATPMGNGSENSKFPRGVTHMDRDGDFWSGNFRGWIQYRQLKTVR